MSNIENENEVVEEVVINTEANEVEDEERGFDGISLAAGALIGVGAYYVGGKLFGLAKKGIGKAKEVIEAKKAVKVDAVDSETGETLEANVVEMNEKKNKSKNK